jgi:ATP/maltotriose-dependent transcriptional regulator MalT/DNA-binding SARP family transcriptional activator
VVGKPAIRSRRQDSGVLHPSPADPADTDDAGSSAPARPLQLVAPARTEPTTRTEPARPAVPYQQAPLGPVEPAAILRHKVQPPPLRTSTLSRQRLLDRLAWATKSRITLVVADAGYGKSTLLADFSRRFDGIALWYSLQPDDLDWLALVPHLVAAAREAKPEFGSLTTSLLRAEPGIAPPKSAVISGLLSELATLHDGRVVIIFDDVHSIEESPDANELLERLVTQAPTNFSFVFSGRRRPAIALARWAGRGELTEITTDDLRFTREDTARLFADSYGQALDEEVLAELESRTQGWAACLQLFSTLISGLSPVAVRAAARSLSGSGGAVFDYLAQEVMAKLKPELQTFLVRASLLQVITPPLARALFADESEAHVDELLRETDALGLVSRASPGSTGRKFHPLLREHLHAELARSCGGTELAAFHAAVATAAESEPLTACHHYIEAGMPEEAVRCLSASALQTLGSGLSGSAARLAARLHQERLSGAVAVMEARRLLEDGNLRAASDLLNTVDASAEPSAIRAALRQTSLNARWRSGDSEAIREMVAEILADEETPQLLHDIALMFRDASSASDHIVALPTISERLMLMAANQRSAGYGYYAAISTHNAAVAALYSGRLAEALDLGAQALVAHTELLVRPPEYYSTCSVLAHAAYELGRHREAAAYASDALASGQEEGDVPAVVAYLSAVTGNLDRARRVLLAVDQLEASGKVDMSARLNSAVARGFLLLPEYPRQALEVLRQVPTEFPLDFESDALVALQALAVLLAGDRHDALRIAEDRLPIARARKSRLAEVRLSLVRALAREDSDDIRTAIDGAAEVSQLALPEAADAIAAHLHHVGPVPDALDRSVEMWRDRWLPVLRRVLDLGLDPRGVVAARLLDKYGEPQDIGRLRAYEKVYRRRAPVTGVGKALARRVSPKLFIHDLGPVSFTIGERQINLSDVRRRSGSVLVYLIARPRHTATREQVIEDLWPEGDVASGSNSLNQSLYFLRREFDPWYEDDVSAEYVSFASELVSLDRDLVVADSVEFMERSRQALTTVVDLSSADAILDLYRGHFAADFEYEEWAQSWRTRVHAAYLDFAKVVMDQAVRRGNLRYAADVCLRVLAVDPEARDMERALLWIYWRLGARSAAETQYTHYAAVERDDGLTPPSLSEITGQGGPLE